MRSQGRRTDFEDLRYEQRGAAALVWFNRPKVRNAIRRRTLDELNTALERTDGDDSVRGVVLAGVGGRAFSSGADMNEMRGLRPETVQRRILSAWGKCIHRIAHSRKPVIGALRGYVHAGGLELANACHIRVAGQSARIAAAEIRRGHLPGAGGLVTTQRLLPFGVAAYYLVTGEDLTATQAYRWGYVQKLVTDVRVVQECVAIVQRIAEFDPIAVELTLRALVQNRDSTLEEAYAGEQRLNAEMWRRARASVVDGVERFVDRHSGLRRARRERSR